MLSLVLAQGLAGKARPRALRRRRPGRQSRRRPRLPRVRIDDPRIDRVRFLRPQEIPTLCRAGHLRPRDLRPRLGRRRPAQTCQSSVSSSTPRRPANPVARSSSRCRATTLASRSRPSCRTGYGSPPSTRRLTRRFFAEHGVNARIVPSLRRDRGQGPGHRRRDRRRDRDRLVAARPTGCGHRDAADVADRAAREPGVVRRPGQAGRDGGHRAAGAGRDPGSRQGLPDAQRRRDRPRRGARRAAVDGSPTVTSLADGGRAVGTVVPKQGVNTLIPALKAAGARDILEIPIAKIVE